ncbi:DUF2142 domain-containing protein [Holdemanella biformis]|uniref:DUF2142 domain-containing protein n=1 Tax=Holdemanella biformis TaxID=1735 RepID=UPI00319DDF6F
MRTRNYTIYASNNNDMVVLNPGDTITQSFHISNKQMEGIQFYSVENRELNDFTMNYTIYDNNDNVLEQNSKQIEKVDQDGPVSLSFSKKITDVNNEKLRLELNIKGTDTLAVKADKNRLAVDVITTELTTFAKVAIVVGLLLMTLFVVTYFMGIRFRIDSVKYAVISIVVLGTILNVFVPVGNVPDEANAHMINAYHMSNQILRIEDDVNNIKMRKCDLSAFGYTYVKDQVMDSYLKKMFDNKDLDTELVNSKHQIVPVKRYSFTYCLSALGISIGRLLGLNGILCILLGRILNFILFVLCIAYCLRNTPIFKSIFIFIGLLPITLQQAFSLSYDSIVLSLSLLIVSLTIQLFHDKKLNAKKWVLLIGSCTLLIPCKSFAYAPLVLAPISFVLTKIDFSKFKNKKGRLFLGILVLAILLIYLLGVAFVGARIQSGTILYLIFNPDVLYRVLRNTLYNRGTFILISALGGSLELCTISIFNPITIAYIVVMRFLIVKMNPKKIGMDKKVQLLFMLIIFISFLGSMLAMYGWSYSMGFFDGKTIEGFQGRYLLPVLPLLFLCSNGQDSDVSDVKTVNICNYLGVLTIFSLLIELLAH